MVAVRNDLTTTDIKILYFLSSPHENCTLKEMSDILDIPKRKVKASVQRLLVKEMSSRGPLESCGRTLSHNVSWQNIFGGNEMSGQKQNYYGSLCTEMYEILHEKAPTDELEFYLSYAEKGMRILEPLCGSGRFLVPFLERGFDISGMDLSEEMLAKLKQKAPGAKVMQTDIVKYSGEETYDYIFIPSGSISLFTDMDICKNILRKMKELLEPGGRFVFAVDTVFNRCADDSGYKVNVSVKTKEGFDLVLKDKNYYEEKSQTQFSPSIYELSNGSELLQRESMDFQTHLYRYGEMEEYLKACGFKNILTWSSYKKETAVNDACEMFIYECSR